MSAEPEGRNAVNVAFEQKKAKILRSLQQPTESYQDASPKGSVDEAIRYIVDLINSLDHYVTTSSCAGRVAVFVDDAALVGDSNASADQEADTSAVGRTSTAFVQSSSGKGNGSRWLFVSHEKISPTAAAESPLTTRLGLSVNEETRHPRTLSDQQQSYVHFKFEPMILHVLAASTQSAQVILTAALQAGFRESGITGLNSACPMVAVRCQGLALASIIGVACSTATSTTGNIPRPVPIVSESYLETLAKLGNDRFDRNAERVSRFTLLVEQLKFGLGQHGVQEKSEGVEARKMRKRTEGLRRQEELHNTDKAQNKNTAARAIDSLDVFEIDQHGGLLGFAD
ncbi:MAG: hypothetical protein Q9159_001613 [Coniocarpon cinnabarinum]